MKFPKACVWEEKVLARIFKQAYFLIFIFPIHSFGGYVIKDDRFVWNRSEIRVCWAGGSGTRFNTCQKDHITFPQRPVSEREMHYRERVEDIVTREFRVQRTGVSFVGWETCSVNEVSQKTDVAIYIQDNAHTNNVFEGEATIGRCLKPNTLSYVRIFPPSEDSLQSALSLEDSLRFIALHEFGHVLGLLHEDVNKKWTIDDLVPGVSVTSFDRFSVMSDYFYFKILKDKGFNFVTDVVPKRRIGDLRFQVAESFEGNEAGPLFQVGLSVGDIHALRCLYVYDEIQFAKTCHKRFKPWKRKSFD